MNTAITIKVHLLAELRPVIDGFFDEVLVMAEDEPIRGNRLALLRNCSPVSKSGRYFILSKS